jgi:hypothetical protein
LRTGNAGRGPTLGFIGAQLATGNDTAFLASCPRRGGKIGDHPPLPFDPMPRHALRNALMIILACMACAAGAAAVDDRYAADPKLAKAPPAPVANQSSGKGEIQVGGVTLSLERGANYWTVTRR